MKIFIIILVILLVFLILCETKLEHYSSDESVSRVASHYNQDKITINNLTIGNSLAVGTTFSVENDLNADNNLTVKNNLNIGGDLTVGGQNSGLPSKSIIIRQKNERIPAGWVPCSGRDGTPDLNHPVIPRKGGAYTSENRDLDYIMKL